MKQTFVKDLRPDSPVRSTFLVQSKERKTTSNGAAYLDLSLQDTTGVISPNFGTTPNAPLLPLKQTTLYKWKGMWKAIAARRSFAFGGSRFARPKK